MWRGEKFHSPDNPQWMRTAHWPLHYMLLVFVIVFVFGICIYLCFILYHPDNLQWMSTVLYV